jgi:anti-sigma factor RsiW
MPKRTRAPKRPTGKTCKQMSALIFNYVNGRLSPRLTREFERHLRICSDCVNFLNTYRKTVSVTGSLNPTAIPAKVRDNVLVFLHKNMKRIVACWLFLASQFTG